MRKIIFAFSAILAVALTDNVIYSQNNLSQLNPDNDSDTLYSRQFLREEADNSASAQSNTQQYPLTLPEQDRQDPVSPALPANQPDSAATGIYPEAAVRNAEPATQSPRTIRYVSPEEFIATPRPNTAAPQPSSTLTPVRPAQQPTEPVPSPRAPVSSQTAVSQDTPGDLAQAQKDKQEKKKKGGVLGGLFNIFRPIEEEKKEEVIIEEQPEPSAPVLPQQPQPTQPMAPEYTPQQVPAEQPPPETIPEPSEPAPSSSQPVDESQINVPVPAQPALPPAPAQFTPENPPPLPPPPENKEVKTIQYQTRDYSKLFGMKGLSHLLLKSHLKIYYGHLNNTNLIIKRLSDLYAKGNSNTFEFHELKRRIAYEFNGMKLHELYFENLGGKTQLHRSTLLYLKMLENFGSYEAWRKEFVATARTKGIQWVILYYDPLQDCLINAGVESNNTGLLAGCAPIIVLDVAEHAYIADYELSKSSYIDMFLKNLDWDLAAMRFKDAKKD